MKVLLVDDDPFVLELLSLQLQTLGCDSVTRFDNARDALRELDRDTTAFDLVFCDLQMPDVDGVEFVRHLANVRFGGGLVLLSGEDKRLLQTVEKLAVAHRLHLVAALSKPASREALKAVLQQSRSRATAAPNGGRPGRRTYASDELELGIARSQLVNHYQPKVDVTSGELLGVEALVRWQHPRDGLVFPDQFIATAERHGLIDALTRAVLAQAVTQLRCWHDAGLPIDMAVNVSMANLTELGFPDLVAQELAGAGVPMDKLVLEVTESRIMENRVGVLDVLTRLRLKQIGLAIDDFGTGHSSLAQLRDVPFDELKIDRGFVTRAWADRSLQAIVESNLAMARQLGMRVVAEGVEELADWNYVRAAGCQAAQGYFIARPMPAEELADWANAWQHRYRQLAAPQRADA